MGDAIADCQSAMIADDNNTQEGLEDFCNIVRCVEHLYNQGEEAMKNEAYRKACNFYGTAIHTAKMLPKESELYRMLYMGRAEAHFKAGNKIQALVNANLVLESQYAHFTLTGSSNMEKSAAIPHFSTELQALVCNTKTRRNSC